MVTSEVNYTSIRCVKCKKLKSVRKSVFLERIKKFGSVEKLITNYLCLGCRGSSIAKRGVTCSRCKEIKSVRKDVYQKRIERYGSEEKLLAKYLCRKCRKKVKKEANRKKKRGDVNVY